MVLPLEVLLPIVPDCRSSSLHFVLVILSILCPLFFYNDCNFELHRARTSRVIVERSSPLSAGWTGSDNTCFAASSVTGKRILSVVCSAFVLSGALIHLNVPI